MSLRILLAGGGTAGHIEPALAVADELRKIDSNISCEFIGTNGALEQMLVPKRGYKLHTIHKVALPRTLSFRVFLFPIQLLRSVIQAKKILQHSDLLIGFGGYVAAPAYLAAFLLRTPIAIHEANAKPGWANRLGRHFAQLVMVNFDSVRRDWPGAVLTGMPIREAISKVSTLTNKSELRKELCAQWNLDPQQPIIAIFGGSQGSLHINQVVKEALPKLGGMQILHAVGINNEMPAAVGNYRPMSYFHDMAAIYSSADLLITRSGAVTCSELTAVGKFAILIPLPHGNGEQVDNAQALVKSGAALMVENADFDGNWLVNNLDLALSKANKYEPKQQDLNSDAALRIAQLALGVLRQPGKKEVA